MNTNEINELLKQNNTKWLITGVAGFIGSHLLERLLKNNQKVVGIDNFSTGTRENLLYVQKLVSNEQWDSFNFIEGDIKNYEVCKKACEGVDIVLHQAALGSVPRSIEDPINTNTNNIDGTLNIFWAAKNSNLNKVIYASSSSVYGDDPDLPKEEDKVGKLLSPYALTKKVNEYYADLFNKEYGLKMVGLRYFNVFGPRQSPDGPYAAVIPQWITSFLEKKPIYIYGDGKTSRDFTYIENIVNLNISAALKIDQLNEGHTILNGACQGQTTLLKVFEAIKEEFIRSSDKYNKITPEHKDFRNGDIRHSLADISKAKSLLDYDPVVNVEDGLSLTVKWYLN